MKYVDDVWILRSRNAYSQEMEIRKEYGGVLTIFKDYPGDIAKNYPKGYLVKGQLTYEILEKGNDHESDGN